MKIIVSRDVKTKMDDEYINCNNIIRMWKSMQPKRWRQTEQHYINFKFVDGSVLRWDYDTEKRRDEMFFDCGQILADKC